MRLLGLVLLLVSLLAEELRAEELRAEEAKSESFCAQGLGLRGSSDFLRAQDEYLYLWKVGVTDLGGEHSEKLLQEGKKPKWLRDNDPLVAQNRIGNDDIRNHLKELFTFTLFMAPRSIVELGVRSGWSTRAFSAAARLIGAKMVGIDIHPAEEATYSQAVEEGLGFFVVGDSSAMAESYPLWAKDHGMPETVDLLFIDTSHLYEETVRELSSWSPFMSERAAIILHDSNLSSQLSYIRKDGTKGVCWDNERGVARAIQEFVGVEYDEENWYDSGAQIMEGWRITHDPTSCGLTILSRGL